MFDTFTVRRSFPGLIPSLVDGDRFAQDAGDGADAEGAAGGSQPSDGDAQLDAGEGADVGDADHGDTGRARAEDADDDDDDDEDHPDRQLPLEEQVKKLRNAVKKRKRQLQSTSADRQLLKELRDRGFTLQDLYADSRDHRRLMAAAERSPKLRAILNGGDTEDAAPARQPAARRAADTEDDFAFDESIEALGFDPKESRANKTLADGLKRIAKLEHTLKKELGRLNPEELVSRVDRLDQEFSRGKATSIRTEWNTATEAAAAQITHPGQRTMFKDLMLFAREKEGGKRPAKFFVDHYLKQLGVNPAQARRASDAAGAQQRGRVAQQVAQLPRQNTGRPGTPAPARQKRETVADVSRRLRAGMGGR